MKTMESKIIITGLLYLITFIFGIWLSFSGRPLNTAIFSVHKIAALLFIVFTGVKIVSLIKTTDVTGLILFIIIITAVIILLSLFSGVWLSLDKKVNELILNIHKLSAIPLGISLAFTIYLLANNSK